jgi:hypothetical protein
LKWYIFLSISAIVSALICDVVLNSISCYLYFQH